MTDDARRTEIRTQVERVVGEWDDRLDAVLELDPEFLATYGRMLEVPSRTGALDARVRPLIALAVVANSTHLYAPAIAPSIRQALDAGNSVDEVMEVLECCATVGIHAMNIGVPILVEVLEGAGLRDGAAELTDFQRRIRDDFTRDRGYWHSFWNEILELAPEFFDAYTDFSSHPWRHGPLSPKVKEFVYITFDTAATHLYTPGLRLHLENAVRYGATAGELVEVMEIAATLGMHGLLEAAPSLLREKRARG